jgi:hypothetical protein
MRLVIAGVLVILTLGVSAGFHSTTHASGSLVDFSEVTGYWEGELERLDRVWRININISPTQPKAEAIVELADFGLYDLPFSVSVENEVFVFELLTEDDDVFRLTGTANENTIIGDLFWQLSTGEILEADLELERTGDEQQLYVEEEIQFQNGPVSLSGTLITPTGNGPFGVLVWMHGSGAQDRGTLHYRSRGYLLARHGFASFIYDKRGTGESTGNWQDASFEDLVFDALAGVNRLKLHSRIDPNRIGIGGMSQGGWLAPLAVTISPDLSFIVVGSTPGITPADQNIYTVENILRNQNFDEDVITEASELQRRVYQYFRTGEDRERLGQDLDLARGEDWFSHTFLPETLADVLPDMSVLDFDPIPIWEQISSPVLSMWGEIDEVVPARESERLIEEALLNAGNTNYDLIVFPKSGHGIRVVVNESDPWDWPRLAPGYHDTMVEWVLNNSN